MKINHIKRLLITGVLSSCILCSYGAKWYISTSGNDTNGTGSISSPWASFSKAHTEAAAGDTIQVSGMIDCTASESGFTQPTGLAITKNLTIQGTSNSTDGFDGKNLTRFFDITNYVVTLKNLKLINGYSGSNNGGAILINSTTTGSLTCENVIFDSNKTGLNAVTSNGNKTGAAIQIDGVNGATFKNCVFWRNEASKAGAIYITSWAANSTIKFEGCAFVNNIAKESFGGSAIFIRSASNNTTLNLINCTIKGNQVVNTTATGGTVNLGGKSMQSTNINIINCTISENSTAGSADKGAGVYVLNSVHNGTSGTNNFIGNLYIKNSIIENNIATNATGGGYSDIALNSTSPTACCTGLNGATGTPGIPGYVKVENSIIGKSGTTASKIPAGNIISSSYDQQSGSTLLAGLGTYNTTLNYYPLQSGSLAVDFGSSGFLSSLSPVVSTDQLGNTRPFTNSKCYAGAVEVKSVTATSNVNVSDLGLTSTSELTVTANELTINQPTTLRSLTVEPGAKVTILGANSLSATNGIVFESNTNATATLLDSYITPTVNASVKQYVTAGRNWYLSAPVSVSGVATLNRGNSVVEWNETTKSWDTKSSGYFVAGKGYIQVSNALQGTTGTVDFSGLTNSGDVSVTVSRTESGANRGFNLVGNPYPSYLDWNDVVADGENAVAGISSSFWYRTKNTDGAYVFTTYNGTSSEVVGGTTANTTINHLIPPMQAFWIKVNPNVGLTTHSSTLKFKNAMREHGLGDNNKLKAPKLNERIRLRLQLENGTSSDETLIYFDKNASDKYDAYDSHKLFNQSETVPDLYSKIADDRFVINGLKDLYDNLNVTLGFCIANAGNLKLRVAELSNLPEGVHLYLLDKNTGRQLELYDGVDYPFEVLSAVSLNESRFNILFRTSNVQTAINQKFNSSINVFNNSANKIVIFAPNNSKYHIYNSLGQLVEEGVVYNNSALSATLKPDVYVVKVAGNKLKVIVTN